LRYTNTASTTREMDCERSEPCNRLVAKVCVVVIVAVPPVSRETICLVSTSARQPDHRSERLSTMRPKDTDLTHGSRAMASGIVFL
jgi:hypothetical protein